MMTRPGWNESTRPSLGGIEPTDYATGNFIATCVAAGPAGNICDVRGSAGPPQCAAFEHPRPIEQSSRKIAARSGNHESPGTRARTQSPGEGAVQGAV